MVRTREELIKIFSEETIDHEIERVKKASKGDILFLLEASDVDDFIVSVLDLAEVKYSTEYEDGIQEFIKA